MIKRVSVKYSIFGNKYNKIYTLSICIVQVIIISFYPLGCSQPSSSDPSAINNAEEYRLIIDDETTTIKTECPTYYFYPGEARRVYVYGKQTVRQDFYLWSEQPSPWNNKGNWTAIGWKENQWVDVDGVNSASKPPFKYASFVSVTLPEDAIVPTTYIYTFRIGGDDTQNSWSGFTTANIKVIANRDFNIKYSYQTDCDIFSPSVAFYFETLAQTAFDGANTKLIFPPEQSSLLNIDVEYGVDGVGLETYIRNNISQEFQSISRLVCIGNSDDAPTAYVGCTMGKLQNDEFYSKWSFVFIDRHTGDNRWKERTYTTIHELGHLRGRESNITDGDHLAGHNGVGKNRGCAMFSFDKLNPTEKDKLLTKPRFCEGHNQILLNKHE